MGKQIRRIFEDKLYHSEWGLHVKMKLRSFLLHKLHEVEQMHEYEVATDTVREWIYIYINKQENENTMGKQIKRIIEDKLYDLELELHIKMNSLYKYDDDERALIYQRINEISESIKEIKESLMQLYSIINNSK